MITKSDDPAAGVRFVYHEYDYRLYYIHFEITGYPCNVKQENEDKSHGLANLATFVAKSSLT